MHEEIKRFGHEGVVAGSVDVIEFKQNMVRWVEAEMKDEGFIPALDIEVQYTQDYSAADDTYKYRLSIYGLYVGRDKAWDAVGVMNGRTIQKYTPQIK